jgi:hypothetical protein
MLSRGQKEREREEFRTHPTAVHRSRGYAILPF